MTALSEPLQLLSLNHITRACSDIRASKRFYRDVLGFVEVKRPSSIDCDGYWLYGYNVQIHLLAAPLLLHSRNINPRSDHISFVANDLDEVEDKLRALGIDTVRETVREAGVVVSQIFFHDPDHNMIEICNCNCLPVVPLSDIHNSAHLDRQAPDMRGNWPDDGPTLQRLPSLQMDEGSSGRSVSDDAPQSQRSSECTHMSHVFSTSPGASPVH